MKKEILVTGAAGKIGSQLVKRLLVDGNSVRAFVLRGDPLVNRLDGLQCKIIEGDLSNEEDVKKAVAGCDAILHMAAMMVKPDEMDETLFMEINVKSTWYLVRNALRENVKRFVYASSDCVYSSQSAVHLPMNEDMPKRPTFLYSLSKNIGELIVMEAYRESNHKLEAVITRFGSVVENDDILGCLSNRLIEYTLIHDAVCVDNNIYNHKTTNPIENFRDLNLPDGALINPIGPDGRSWRIHFTHIEDTVDGVMLALEKEEAVGEAFNIHSPSAITWEAAIKYIAEKTGQKYYDAQLENFWEFENNISKARKILGYNPKYDTYSMIDSAIEYREKNNKV